MFVFIGYLCATFIFCVDVGFKVFYFYRYFKLFFFLYNISKDYNGMLIYQPNY